MTSPPHASAMKAASTVTSSRGGSSSAVVAAALGVAFVVTTFAIPVKRGRGMAGLVTDVLARPELRHSVILICSQGDGEGIIISEMAMREHRPGHYLLRGSKVLASAQWNGRDYHARFADADAVMRYLESVPVAVLIMDSTPGQRDHLHYHQLEEALAKYPDRWQLLGRYPADGRPRVPGQSVRVYRLLGADTAPSQVKLEVDPMLRGLEER